MGVFNNFPYANFHELNADWIIEQVRKVMDDWEEYRTDMNLWKLGVDDQLAEFQAWFDNLDVQDEVRTVMNELILSGEFIEITSPQIISATETWLAEHVTPTSPAVDNTLSISGAAADAKVTGDRIADLKEDIYEIETIVGGNVDAQYTLVNQMYNSQGDLVSPQDTYKFYEIDNLLGVRQITFNFENDSGGYTTHYFNQFDENDTLIYYTPFYDSSDSYTANLLDNCVKVRVMVYNTNGEFSPSYTVETIKDIVEEINDIIGGERDLTQSITNTMYGSDGTEKSPTSSISFREVDNLTGISEVTFHFENIGAVSTHWFNQFDENDTLLSYVPFYIDSNSGNSLAIELNANTAYIKYSVWTDNGTSYVTYNAKSDFALTAKAGAGIEKMSALGDSITFGYTANGNITNTYQKQIADMLGCEFQKLGVISTPICPNSDYTGGQNDDAFVYRWDQIASDADIIIVAGGTNDYGHNVPLGTPTDNISLYEQTFYGAVNYLITNITVTYPYARVVFITPFHRQGDYQQNTAGYTLLDYVEAIQNMCKRYGVKCIDGYSDSGINTLQAFQNVNMSDGLHPTQSGHDLIFKNLMPFFAMS